MGKETGDLYSKVIIDVARDPNISRSAKALYMILCTYRNTITGKAWPTNNTLLESLGGSGRNNIGKWFEELVDKKVISLEYERRHESKQHIRIVTFLHNYRDKSSESEIASI